MTNREFAEKFLKLYWRERWSDIEVIQEFYDLLKSKRLFDAWARLDSRHPGEIDLLLEFIERSDNGRQELEKLIFKML